MPLALSITDRLPMPKPNIPLSSEFFLYSSAFGMNTVSNFSVVGILLYGEHFIELHQKLDRNPGNRNGNALQLYNVTEVVATTNSSRVTHRTEKSMMRK